MLQAVLFILMAGNGLVSTGNSSHIVDQEAIQQVIQQKEEAVNQHHKQLFLSLIHPHHKMYAQEQKHWFDDAVHYIDPNSYHLNVENIQVEKNHTATGVVSQEYTHQGKRYRTQYPLRFCKFGQTWKDDDIAFKRYSKGSYTVYYTDKRIGNQARVALQMLERATVKFKDRYAWTPKRIEVKLYHQPEVFRQSVKLSLPTWAGGWHESRQAIKFVGGVVDDATFSQGIVHELTHQMVSELTNDNASYWLQEGAAMYYERHLLGQRMGAPFPKSLLSLSQLEKMNLESLPDKEASRYYLSCYCLFKAWTEKYGEKRVEKLLSVLRKHKEIDLDSAQKMKMVNDRTKQAMKEVFGTVNP